MAVRSASSDDMNQTRMTLSRLLTVSGIACRVVGAYRPDVRVAGLTYKSSEAISDGLFFCLVGASVDGHRFAPDAYAHGCRAFVVERVLDLPSDSAQILVSDSRASLADLSRAFYGFPDREISVIGLTGTKGKTTTALMIHHILNSYGLPCGYIGTNGIRYADREYPTDNSTPESAVLYRTLREMIDAGMRACAIEVSSQALWRSRVRGMKFDVTVFTNLSRDHIGPGEHPDFNHYKNAKKSLFTLGGARLVIANRDDAAWTDMIADCPPDTRTVTVGRDGVVGAYGMSVSTERGDGPSAGPLQPGTGFDVIGPDSSVIHAFLPLPGDHNAQNALTALAVCAEGYGVPVSDGVRHLAGFSVPGRLECLRFPSLPDVLFFIDYAHNAVSLTSTLETLRPYVNRKTGGRLICLFGSVGGRTKERRADLAAVAGSMADTCIITSDNPNREDPDAIISEIAAHFAPDACPRVCVTDRAEAIRLSVDMASAGDVVLLAGKGHETYQLINGEKIAFCERDILKKAVERRAREAAE